MGECEEGCDPSPQKRQPPQQEVEVVAGGGSDGVDRITGAVGEVVAAHPVLVLQVADHRLHG